MAEVGALADEAGLPLDELLAQYGFRIGPDGTKQRITDEETPDLAGAESSQIARRAGAASIWANSCNMHVSTTRFRSVESSSSSLLLQLCMWMVPL